MSSRVGDEFRLLEIDADGAKVGAQRLGDYQGLITGVPKRGETAAIEGLTALEAQILGRLAIARRSSVEQVADDTKIPAEEARRALRRLGSLGHATKIVKKDGAVVESPVTIAVNVHPDEVAISVSDEGPGIPAEELDLVFRRYYRRRGARESDGTGLGLYITRLIVEAHGGRIWAESGQSRPGTRFSLVLPSPRG